MEARNLQKELDLTTTTTARKRRHIAKLMLKNMYAATTLHGILSAKREKNPVIRKKLIFITRLQNLPRLHAIQDAIPIQENASPNVKQDSTNALIQICPAV